jgi:tetratricopeptide (TPR) repeat protein
VRRAVVVLVLAAACGRPPVDEAWITPRIERLQQDRRDRDAWADLAVAAIELGQLDNARFAARRILAIAPGDAQAADVLVRVGDAPARRRAAKAPEDPETKRRCEAARVAIDAGRLEEAAVLLRVAAWMDEASPLPHQYLANLNVMRGRPLLALRHQRAALARAPNSPLYRKNMRVLREAQRARTRAALEQVE